jgi:hypothetical protein
MRCRLLPVYVLSLALALSSRAAISQEKEDADAILRAYVVDVAEKIGENPRALGSQDAILKKYQELGEKHLLANKEILHKKAATDYLKLDVWSPPKNYVIKPRPESAEALKEFEDIFSKGYGVPPYDYHVFATLWWDPQHAAKVLRELVTKRLFSRDDVERRKFLEQFVAPRVYRQNGDGEHPVICYFDGKELCVVKLAYTEIGIYALEKLEWYDVTVQK